MIRLLCFALVLVGLAAPAAAAPGSALLPRPAALRPAAGSLLLRPGDRIAFPAADRGAANAAARLTDLLARTKGLRLRSAPGAASAPVRFRRIPGLAAEAYRLQVTREGATVSASDDAGLLYGGISLWQLATASPEPRIAAVEIEDRPRFGWRGLMLDSARHYQSPAFIRRLIDAMAATKLNRLHWHLVDDQGWRLEIRKYPRLTAVGAWRRPSTAPGAPPLPREGGFYSQAEVRAIVAYAAARNITIVPEIEMPGHALSAIRAYPRLGMGVPVPPGVESDSGVFPWLYNVDPATIRFLTDVLDEVMALFPSTWIHVGGDEAVKDQWHADPGIQARIKALGLANEDALQGWLVNRIEAHLRARGRRLIGWDEILDGGINASAAVMSWRGIDGAVAAARAGHDTVLSPAPILYFDNIQSRGGAGQPGRGNLIDLAKVYGFDPAPPSLTADQQRHVLGLQANLWTEHIRGDARAAFMAFPRALAVAELGWSPPTGRDFHDFALRAALQADRLARLGIVGSPEAFVPMLETRFDPPANRVRVELSNQAATDIRYTLDGSEPGIGAALYAAPLDLALPARIRARAFAAGRALPGSLDRRLDPAGLRRRTDAELDSCEPGLQLALEDDAPVAGPRATFLVNIMKPCWRYRNAEMDGVTGVTIDVGQLPFNFQIGSQRDEIRFAPPRSAAGEMEVRADGCEGAPIAILPLAPAVANPAVTRLRAKLPPLRGRHDLCFTYTARGPNPLWAIDAVQLETGP
jgi:hexosaminidase